MGNLPFEKDNSRRWACFICGKQHTDFETFKKHILETHEEGREYVKCPLPHCGAPVRDVRLHVKFRHPESKCPTTGMLKALIWKDVSGTGKMKTRKPTFREGHFISVKNGGKELHYRSGMECRTYELLEELPEVIAYNVEPFVAGIPYVAPADAREHKYFPDLSVQFNDGHIEIWEIKPGSQTALPVNEAKWTAAHAFCQARGWDFIVITEVGLERLQKRVRIEKATAG